MVANASNAPLRSLFLTWQQKDVKIAQLASKAFQITPANDKMIELYPIKLVYMKYNIYITYSVFYNS